MRMNILDGCYSLKLECAIRNLGFVETHGVVIANAGVYFVRPVGPLWVCEPDHDLLGFQLRKPVRQEMDSRGFHLGWPTLPSAREALDLAISLS